jgi:hypothetical protein
MGEINIYGRTIKRDANSLLCNNKLQVADKTAAAGFAIDHPILLVGQILGIGSEKNYHLYTEAIL